jgi:hypothetical protein
MNATTNAESRLPPGRAAENKSVQEVLFVLDPSAIPGGPSRAHDMPTAEGGVKSYGFAPNVATEVPTMHAMRFLASGFKVFADKAMTRPIAAPRSLKAGHDGQNVLELRPDEVIAALYELTKDALFKRAAALPGGEKLDVRADKTELMRIIAAFNAGEAAARNRKVDEQIEVGPEKEELAA